MKYFFINMNNISWHISFILINKIKKKLMNKIVIFAFVTLSFLGFISCNNKPASKAKTTEEFIEDTIFSLKEVLEKNKLIDSISNHKQGVAIMIDKPTEEEKDYVVKVGYNGNERFETYFIFCYNQNTKEISIIDPISGSKLPLETWRNNLKENIYVTKGMDLVNTEKIGNLSIGLSENKTIEILGNPDKKSEANKWETDGLMHQEWYYMSKGIELDLCWDDKKHKEIFRITINKPCDYKTSRNIGIGSTIKDVETAYSQEIDKNRITETAIIAGSEFGGLIFTIENNLVVSIFLGSAAE